MSRKHKKSTCKALVLGGTFRGLFEQLLDPENDCTIEKPKKKKEKFSPPKHVYQICPVEPLSEE